MHDTVIANVSQLYPLLLAPVFATGVIGRVVGVAHPDSDDDRARRARWRQLDDPHPVAGLHVVIQPEAHLVDVERLGPVHVLGG